jgi:hypothetical protein
VQTSRPHSSHPAQYNPYPSLEGGLGPEPSAHFQRGDRTHPLHNSLTSPGSRNNLDGDPWSSENSHPNRLSAEGGGVPEPPPGGMAAKRAYSGTLHHSKDALVASGSRPDVKSNGVPSRQLPPSFRDALVIPAEQTGGWQGGLGSEEGTQTTQTLESQKFGTREVGRAAAGGGTHGGGTTPELDDQGWGSEVLQPKQILGSQEIGSRELGGAAAVGGASGGGAALGWHDRGWHTTSSFAVPTQGRHLIGETSSHLL